MGLDRQNVKALQIALGEAASAVAAKSGIAGIEVCRGSRASFDPVSGTVKVTVEFRIATDDQERAAFAHSAALFGLKAEAYGETISSRGKAYKLVGFALRRSRFPIVGEGSDGKRMLFPTDILRQLPAVRYLRETSTSSLDRGSVNA